MSADRLAARYVAGANMNADPNRHDRPKVFLSYAWDLRHGPYYRWVGAFATWLRDRGVDVVFDQQVQGGVPIHEWIDSALGQASCVVFLCSPSFKSKVGRRILSWTKKSRYLRREIDLALKLREGGQMRVLVVFVEGSFKSAVPEELAVFNTLDLTGHEPNYPERYQHLLKELGASGANNFVPYGRWAAKERAILRAVIALAACLATYRLWPCPSLPEIEERAVAASLLPSLRRIVNEPMRPHCRDQRLLGLLLWDKTDTRSAAAEILVGEPERGGDERCDLVLKGLERLAPPASAAPLSHLWFLFKRYCQDEPAPDEICAGVKDPQWMQDVDPILQQELVGLCQPSE